MEKKATMIGLLWEKKSPTHKDPLETVFLLFETVRTKRLHQVHTGGGPPQSVALFWLWVTKILNRVWLSKVLRWVGMTKVGTETDLTFEGCNTWKWGHWDDEEERWREGRRRSRTRSEQRWRKRECSSSWPHLLLLLSLIILKLLTYLTTHNSRRTRWGVKEE